MSASRRSTMAPPAVPKHDEPRSPTSWVMAPVPTIDTRAAAPYMSPRTPTLRIKSECISPLTTVATPTPTYRGTPIPRIRTLASASPETRDRLGSLGIVSYQSPSLRFYTPHWTPNGHPGPLAPISPPVAPVADMISMANPYGAPFSAPAQIPLPSPIVATSPTISAPYTPMFPAHPFTVHQYIPWLAHTSQSPVRTSFARPTFVGPRNGSQAGGPLLTGPILRPRHIAHEPSEDGDDYSVDLDTDLSTTGDRDEDRDEYYPSSRPWATKTLHLPSASATVAAPQGRYNLRNRQKRPTVIRRLIAPPRPPDSVAKRKGPVSKTTPAKAKTPTGVTKRKAAASKRTTKKGVPRKAKDNAAAGKKAAGTKKSRSAVKPAEGEAD